jgi:pilus assembly protein CpaF
VTRISEVAGLKDGEYRMEDIFVYRINGQDENGKARGGFFATGHQPVALRRLALTGVNIDQYAPLFEPRELEQPAVE